MLPPRFHARWMINPIVLVLCAAVVVTDNLRGGSERSSKPALYFETRELSLLRSSQRRRTHQQWAQRNPRLLLSDAVLVSCVAA